MSTLLACRIFIPVTVLVSHVKCAGFIASALCLSSSISIKFQIFDILLVAIVLHVVPSQTNSRLLDVPDYAMYRDR